MYTSVVTYTTAQKISLRSLFSLFLRLTAHVQNNSYVIVYVYVLKLYFSENVFLRNFESAHNLYFIYFYTVSNCLHQHEFFVAKPPSFFIHVSRCQGKKIRLFYMFKNKNKVKFEIFKKIIYVLFKCRI